MALRSSSRRGAHPPKMPIGRARRVVPTRDSRLETSGACRGGCWDEVQWGTDASVLAKTQLLRAASSITDGTAVTRLEVFYTFTSNLLVCKI
jgi:hypothetical protein